MNIYSIYNSRLTCATYQESVSKKQKKPKVDDMAHQVKVHVAAWHLMVSFKS